MRRIDANIDIDKLLDEVVRKLDAKVFERCHSFEELSKHIFTEYRKQILKRSGITRRTESK